MHSPSSSSSHSAAARLIDALNARGLSVRAIARASGVSPSYISLIRSGQRNGAALVPILRGLEQQSARTDLHVRPHPASPPAQRGAFPRPYHPIGQGIHGRPDIPDEDEDEDEDTEDEDNEDDAAAQPRTFWGRIGAWFSPPADEDDTDSEDWDEDDSEDWDEDDSPGSPDSAPSIPEMLNGVFQTLSLFATPKERAILAPLAAAPVPGAESASGTGVPTQVLRSLVRDARAELAGQGAYSEIELRDVVARKIARYHAQQAAGIPQSASGRALAPRFAKYAPDGSLQSGVGFRGARAIPHEHTSLGYRPYGTRQAGQAAPGGGHKPIA